MKIIITILAFIFLIYSPKAFSQVGVSNLSTSEHNFKSYNFPNYYIGKDIKYAYYINYDSLNWSYFKVDNNLTCSDRIIFSITKNPEIFINKDYRLNFKIFNKKAYVFYKAFSHTSNNWKLYVSEIPEDGNIKLENSIVLAESNATGSEESYQPVKFQPEILLNHDSTEIAVIANTLEYRAAVTYDHTLYLESSHANIFNTDFKKIKDADLNISTLNKPNLQMEKAVYDNNKLIFLTYSESDWKDMLQLYDVLVYDFNIQKIKSIEIPSSKFVDIGASGNNIKFSNGFLYIFGRIRERDSKGKFTDINDQLILLKIDIEKGQCKIKNAPGADIEKQAKYFFTLDIGVCSDSSIIIINRYELADLRTDTLDYLKFDNDLNLVLRKKILTKTDWPNYMNRGFFLNQAKKVYLYSIPDKIFTKGSKSSFMDLIEIELDEEGSLDQKIIFQYENSDYRPSYRSLGLINDKLLLIEFYKKNAQFLKIQI